MEFLPQELVDAIVCKIDDNPSLKACALAGRMFCERSQRIILQSLTLRSPHSNFGRVHALLEESPHIAAYITHLTIRLRWDTPAADIQSLQQILGKLENVRRCTIGGMSFLFSLGYYHSPTFQSVLLDFLAHQPLRELYVQFTNAPPAIILRLFTIAPPMLFFSSVGVKAESEDPMLGAQKNAPKIDHLVLGQSTRKVHQLLTRPQLESYTQGLRRLSIFPHHDPSNKLLFRTAETLQYINFNLGPAIPTPDIPVPPLPLLRSVAFSLPLCNHTIPRFSDFISTILGAAPYLPMSRFRSFSCPAKSSRRRRPSPRRCVAGSVGRCTRCAPHKPNYAVASQFH
ncbi:hypothetical protein B0H13DRAFT_1158878 [Mycena leptocephala]|nr:hypothetical protein B0H13DRAFT_1158878 [Mycena leptocephala]